MIRRHLVCGKQIVEPDTDALQNIVAGIYGSPELHNFQVIVLPCH